MMFEHLMTAIPTPLTKMRPLPHFCVLLLSTNMYFKNKLSNMTNKKQPEHNKSLHFPSKKLSGQLDYFKLKGCM